MTVQEIKALLKTNNYDFLRNNPHLSKNVILLTLGGSHAYGTNKEGSDVDIRGITANTKREILLGQDFESVVDVDTDTTIYSLKKIVTLLQSCNPNTIEILGCLPEHYLYVSKIGQSLLDNKDMFLSQIAVHSFGGYAESQLRRLESKSVDSLEQAKREQHILKSINRSKNVVLEKYQKFADSGINFYTDKAITPDLDEEIFLDTRLTHYPLRDLKSLLNEFGNILSSYSKLGTRNNKAFLHDKVGKHSMHLIRLYMMCIDILEKGEIHTYRTDEHELLMKIRNNEFLDENNVPIPEFYDLVNQYSKRLDYAAAHTNLPVVPDKKRIEDWMCWATQEILNGNI